MFNCFAENLKIRCNALHSPSRNIRILGNPFSVEKCNALKKLEFELFEQRLFSLLRSSFKLEALLPFYAFLSASPYVS
jgi:hypothetical protein